MKTKVWNSAFPNDWLMLFYGDLCITIKLSIIGETGDCVAYFYTNKMAKSKFVNYLQNQSTSGKVIKFYW